MEIEKFKQEVLRVFSEIGGLRGMTLHTKQGAMIHLTEEVGELAKQITNESSRPKKFDKNNLATELADIMMFIVLLSNLYEVNLSKEMEEAIKRVEAKIKKIRSKGK